MKTLYFDCFAGASGNMILGGLIALGVERDELIREIRRLDIANFDMVVDRADRAGIAATHVKVAVPDEIRHRHLRDIKGIIQNSGLSTDVKKRSIAIFTRLAEAEAIVHGIDVEKVHFHEVGAMDAIVDVVGACIGFEMLGVECFTCSKIHVGSGFVEIAHGKYPVPPPAVVELLKNAPIYSTEIDGELLTPTGAAIITTLCSSYGTFPDMELEGIGYGAGSREYDRFPNVLRLVIGETSANGLFRSLSGAADDTLEEDLVLLETNIDDVAPQVLGFVMERALELGALDCWFTPIQMKKNRPATMLSVLCSAKVKEPIMEMLYLETTSLGIRRSQVERNSLRRETVSVETEYGAADVKVARYGDKIVNVMPEYEHVRELAIANNVPFSVVHAAVLTNFKGLSRSAGT